MYCWTWNCPFTGRESYLEWDKNNSLEFGYENEKNCLTVYIGIWRFLCSKPETIKLKENNGDIDTTEGSEGKPLRSSVIPFKSRRAI